MNSEMQQRLKTVGPFPAAMTDEQITSTLVTCEHCVVWAPDDWSDPNFEIQRKRNSGAFKPEGHPDVYTIYNGMTLSWGGGSGRLSTQWWVCSFHCDMIDNLP
jgi:hypothetical protein